MPPLAASLLKAKRVNMHVTFDLSAEKCYVQAWKQFMLQSIVHSSVLHSPPGNGLHVRGQLQLPGHTVPEVTRPHCQALSWLPTPVVLSHTPTDHVCEERHIQLVNQYKDMLPYGGTKTEFDRRNCIEAYILGRQPTPRYFFYHSQHN